MIYLKACLPAIALMTSTLAQSCPVNLTVPNHGFETGRIGPWYTPAPQEGQPTATVIPPGYNSRFALQIGVPKNNFTELSLVNGDIGKQCEGYTYRISWAYNWDTYSGPPSDEFFGCKLGMQSSYCYGNIVGAERVFATKGTGWKTHSFTCEAKESFEATYTLDFSCFGNETYDIPAFNFEVDNLNIKLLGKKI